MLQSLSPRLVFFGLALMALIAVVFARFYLQEALGLPPCPLCMTQRVFVVLWGSIALLAALPGCHLAFKLGYTIASGLGGGAPFQQAGVVLL